MEKNKPTHEIKLGSVKATIWANKTKENGIKHNVQFCRLYKKDNTWESSQSFSRQDLLLLAKLADLTHTWLYKDKT